jgi:hypothetical protein
MYLFSMDDIEAIDMSSHHDYNIVCRAHVS